MNDHEYKQWDLRIKIATLVAAAIGGVWALCSYRLTTEKEFRRPLWDKQLSLYFDASVAAGKIATLPASSKDRESSISDFWNLYFGPLVVVEDDENVCKAMVDFGNCLPVPGRSYPEDSSCEVEDEPNRAVLRDRALKMANAIQVSIG